MKLIKNITAVSLSLALLSPTSIFAQDYQGQVDFDYLTDDSADIISLGGTYYWNGVNTGKGPIAEAAFIDRSNNASLEYIKFDDFADAFGVAVEFFGDQNNNLYGAIGITEVDTDFGSGDTVLFGEFGYFFAENWLVALSATDSDGSDPVTLRTKYVGGVADGQYINLEASISDESNSFELYADYYWNEKSSLGLIYLDQPGTDFGLRYQYFFTPTVSFKASFLHTGDDDVFGIGLSARF